MALLTMTPAIVAGIQKIDACRITISSPAPSGQVDDDETVIQNRAGSMAGAQEDFKKLLGKHSQLQPERNDNTVHTEGVTGYQSAFGHISSTEPSLQHPKSGNPISHIQIIALSRQLKVLNFTEYHLDTLLRGSYVYVAPPPPKPEPTSEYKALMARLRREADAREYNHLISPAPPSETYSKNLPATSPAFAFASTEAYIDASPDDETTYADINRQMTLIFNVLISIIACSAALWMVSKWWSTPARLALSMGGSIVVAIAEVGVYFGYIRKVKEAVKAENEVKEVKEVVHSWVFSPGEEGTDQVQDTEELPLLKEKGKEDAVRRRGKKTVE